LTLANGDSRQFFAKRLRDLHKAAGLPKLEKITSSVAPSARVTVQALSDWTRGETVPRDFLVLEAVLRVLIGEARKRTALDGRLAGPNGLYDLVAWGTWWQEARSAPTQAPVGMRYYEYLSSAKVDMLFPQIDRSSKTSSKTAGRNPLSVYEKLTEVENWIHAHNELVGTVDEPAAWISGRMRLGMTVVPKEWERRDSPEVPLDGTVLFAGDSGDGACVVMGGSARHLFDLRALPVADVQYRQPGSGATALGILLRCYPDFDDPVPPEGFAERPLQDRYQLIARPAKDILLAATGMGRRSPGGLDAAGGEFEFLAKRLQTFTSGKRTASLATPLFVARID
jgi:hypothetical protein